MEAWNEKYEIREDDHSDGEWGIGYDDDDGDSGPIYEDTFERQVAAASSKEYAEECGAMPAHKVGSDEFRREMARKTPMERFKLKVNKVSLGLNDNFDTISLSKSDRNMLCREADSTKGVGTDAKYLNPLAYVLGYVAYQKNCIITEGITEGIAEGKFDDSYIKRVGEIFGDISGPFGRLKEMNDVVGDDYQVYPADVIRYGRFWAIRMNINV